MILDSGTMFICELLNTAENGRMPIEVLNPINKHWYQERTIGMSRQYMAQGVNERVDRYVRLFGPRLPVGLVKVALPTLDLASDCLQMTLPLAPWCGTALISQSKI